MEWNFDTARMERVTHVKHRTRNVIKWIGRDEKGDSFQCHIYDSSKLDKNKCHYRTVHEKDLLPSSVADFNNNTKKSTRRDRAMRNVGATNSTPGSGSLPKRKPAIRKRSTKKQKVVDSPAIDYSEFEKRESALANVLKVDGGAVVAVGPYALRSDLANLAMTNDVPAATQAGWHEMREAQHILRLLDRQKVLTSQYLRRARCFGVVGTSAFYDGNVMRPPCHDRTPPGVNHINTLPYFCSPFVSSPPVVNQHRAAGIRAA
jgi:hypothetical protein